MFDSFLAYLRYFQYFCTEAENNRQAMKRIFITFITIMLAMTAITAKTKTVTLKFIETSDVHGAFFPTDYMTGKDAKGSMARVSTYLKQLRAQYGKDLILLENGDIMQGQPTNYFWNYIKTDRQNIASSIVNYLKYDAQTFGNHDVETGHNVYDKWAKDLRCPLLGANVINTKTGEPYTTPYIVLKRDGVKIAIIGMLTPAVPNWLSGDLWSGIAFENIVTSARKWVETVKAKESPDLIIGLFHSGRQGGITTGAYEENATEAVAREVPGFDVIFYGHDHNPFCGEIANEGGSTHIIDPGSNARQVGECTITITRQDGKTTEKKIQSKLTSVDDCDVDEAYMKYFEKDIAMLKEYISEPVGYFDSEVRTRDSFFGPSSLTDLILQLQLSITGADISLNAPLLMNSTIAKGPVTVADMFSLYKYENKLCVMRMTGKEIKGHLEMSYAIWTNQMKSPDDHILLLDDTKNDGERAGFKHPFFNFDSAAGIIYEVDVTKPAGEKVRIISMEDGTPFDEDKWYKVAINSYRANGGGELITKGAGIPKDSLEERTVWRSELDQRYYLMKEIEKCGHVNPQPASNWKFVPEEYARPAVERDRKLLFGK